MHIAGASGTPHPGSGRFALTKPEWVPATGTERRAPGPLLAAAARLGQPTSIIGLSPNSNAVTAPVCRLGNPRREGYGEKRPWRKRALVGEKPHQTPFSRSRQRHGPAQGPAECRGKERRPGDLLAGIDQQTGLLAGPAVLSEPVSAGFPCLTGKKQGVFEIRGRSRALRPCNTLVFRILFIEFPARWNREYFCRNRELEKRNRKLAIPAGLWRHTRLARRSRDAPPGSADRMPASAQLRIQL